MLNLAKRLIALSLTLGLLAGPFQEAALAKMPSTPSLPAAFESQAVVQALAMMTHSLDSGTHIRTNHLLGSAARLVVGLTLLPALWANGVTSTPGYDRFTHRITWLLFGVFTGLFLANLNLLILKVRPKRADMIQFIGSMLLMSFALAFVGKSLGVWLITLASGVAYHQATTNWETIDWKAVLAKLKSLKHREYKLAKESDTKSVRDTWPAAMLIIALLMPLGLAADKIKQAFFKPTQPSAATSQEKRDKYITDQVIKGHLMNLDGYAQVVFYFGRHYEKRLITIKFESEDSTDFHQLSVGPEGSVVLHLKDVLIPDWTKVRLTVQSGQGPHSTIRLQRVKALAGPPYARPGRVHLHPYFLLTPLPLRAAA